MARIEIIPPAAGASDAAAAGDGSAGSFRGGRAPWEKTPFPFGGRAAAHDAAAAAPGDDAPVDAAVDARVDAETVADSREPATAASRGAGAEEFGRIESMIWTWPPRGASEAAAGRAGGGLSPISAIAAVAVAMVVGFFALVAALAFGALVAAVSVVGAVLRGVLGGGGRRP